MALQTKADCRLPVLVSFAAPVLLNVPDSAPVAVMVEVALPANVPESAPVELIVAVAEPENDPDAEPVEPPLLYVAAPVAENAPASAPMA